MRCSTQSNVELDIEDEEIGFMHIDRTDFGSFTLAERIRHLEVEGHVVLPDVLDVPQIERLKGELRRTCPCSTRTTARPRPMPWDAESPASDI